MSLPWHWWRWSDNLMTSISTACLMYGISANTPVQAPYTDKRGCADMDGDGYFTPDDDCPTEGSAPVDSSGCPITTTSYTVTASARTGDQSVRRELARLKREVRCLSLSQPIRTTLLAPIVGLAQGAACLGRLTLPVLSPATLSHRQFHRQYRGWILLRHSSGSSV